MIIASTSRGIQTFACKAGCNSYTYIFTDEEGTTTHVPAPTPAPTPAVYLREFAYA